MALRNDTSSESRNFLANILCKLVSKEGMDFLDNDKDIFWDDDVDVEIFNEIGAAGDDLFGRCTMDEDLEAVGDEGIEILTYSSSKTRVLHVANSSTVSFSSNVNV